MCGITGVLNISHSTPIDPSLLEAANKTIKHRGPDDAGLYVEDGFGMAMRRLSIIDIDGGHQPIHSPCGRFHICYNGELYNFLELKRELTSLGHQFRTRADSEVVLHAFMEWGGEGSLRKMRGMFAFCVWDSLSKNLFLGRDRLGIKPLYYLEHDGRLYFASEIRGLLLHSGISRQVDLRALDAIMTVGFSSAPHTLFKGVRKLPAAHYLIVKGGHTSVQEYWTLDYTVDAQAGKSDAIEQFYAILSESVHIHLMSDVPVGALLSGGIDSTTVAALIRQKGRRPLKTISIGFEQEGYNEADLAEASARYLGTDHHYVTFDNFTMDGFPSALYYREEPSADAIFVAGYYLFKACKQQNLKVVLSGEGADELLGGYAWHRWEHWLTPWLQMPDMFKMLMGSVLSMSIRHHEGIQRMAAVLNRPGTDIVERYINYIRIGDSAVKDGLYSADVQISLKESQEPPIIASWNNYVKQVADQPAGSQLLWLQTRTRLPDWINIAVDRMSMAHSIEVRPPFLDHRLWEFCATLPHRFKMGGSYLKPIEKKLLREATREQIPEAVRRRRKKGLQVPHAVWLAKPDLPDWAEWMLSESQIIKRNIFNPKAVKKLREAHYNGVTGLDRLLISVLAIQTWHHLFFDGALENNAPVLS